MEATIAKRGMEVLRDSEGEFLDLVEGPVAKRPSPSEVRLEVAVGRVLGNERSLVIELLVEGFKVDAQACPIHQQTF